jgi:beta-lactamase regulating signal transducer with metallopeptidase domain
MKAVWEGGVFLPELCRDALQVGLGLALQSTLLLGLGLLAARVLRARGPGLAALIYQVCLCGTVAGALLSVVVGGQFQPLWSVSLPSVTGEALPSAAWQSGAVLPGEAGSGAGSHDPWGLRESVGPRSGVERVTGNPVKLPAGGVPARGAAAPIHGGAPVPGAEGRPAGSGIGGLYVALVAVWGGGTVLLLGWLLLCQFRLHRLRRGSVRIQEGPGAGLLDELCRSLRLRPPLLLTSPEVQSPFLAGPWRPAIVLSADSEERYDAAILRTILMHELVHLSRGDCAWRLLARLACAVGWLQPLLWVLCRRLVEASEAVCDQEVVRREGDPRGYAHCLLSLSEQLRSSRAERALGVGMAAFRSSLGRRIQQILESSRGLPPALTVRMRMLVGLGAAAAMVAGLVLVSVVAAPPDAAGERGAAKRDGQPARFSLSRVPELGKRVTITEAKVPLGELVQKVAAETGASLVTAPGVADEPVTVVVKELTAGVLLEQLADLLDYRWSRRGREGAWRYEIEQDLASKQREEGLRRQAWADVEKRFQAEVKRQIEAPTLSPAEIRRVMLEEEDRGQKLKSFTTPQQRDAFLNSPQQRARRQRVSDAMRQSSPISMALTRFVGRLTPRQWATLREGEPLRFSTDPQAGELPLPADLEQTLRKSQPIEYPAGYRIYPDNPDVDAEIRQREKANQERWAAATSYRVTVRVGPSPVAPHLRTTPSLGLSVSAEPVRGGEPEEESWRHHGGGADIGVRAGPLRSEAWALENTPERSAALARDPVLGARRAFKPSAKPRPTPNWGPNAVKIWRLGELLPEVARTYGVNLIGDAYWSAPAVSVPQLSAGAPQPLYQVLDRLTAPGVKWEKRGPVIRLRSRNWHFDRPREIPLRLVQRWEAIVEERGALPVEEYARSVAPLGDEQLESTWLFQETAAFPPALSDLGSVYHSRHALRLYASLSAGQRQAQWRGEAIRVAEMLPAQQALYREGVRESTRFASTPPDDRQWASARLSLQGFPMVRVRERRSTGDSERTELVTISRGGKVDTVAVGTPDLKLEPIGAAEAAAAARAATALPGVTPAGNKSAAPAKVTRFPVLNLLFRWEHSPTAKEWSGVTVAAP